MESPIFGSLSGILSSTSELCRRSLFDPEMMDEASSTSYVQLTKEQDAPMEEISPGELNQPIRVPQLEGRRCLECGQPLPEAYEPPANEPWTTGICGCAEDTDSCWSGLFCPCVLFGHNVEKIREDTPWTTACVCHAIFIEGGIALGAATAMLHGIDPETSCLIVEGLMFTWWMCGVYTGIYRQTLQRKYHLKDAPCDPCMVHCCMHWCAICQEHREMKGRLSDNTAMSTAIVDPPAMQEMNANDSRGSAASKSGGQHSQQGTLELQAV